MPRLMRVEYPGAAYYVMSRGDRRENICVDDVDRQDFVKGLAEACMKAGFEVHAYCLMRNHFHLAVEGTRPGWAWEPGKAPSPGCANGGATMSKTTKQGIYSSLSPFQNEGGDAA
jgi:hypothetical protein